MGKLGKKVRKKILASLYEYDLPKFKRCLRKYKFDIDVDDFEEQMTPLHLACANGKIAFIRYMVKKGANLLKKNKTGQLPIHVAVNYLLKSEKLDEDLVDIVFYLVKKCPLSTAVPDHNGLTVQSAISYIEHLRPKISQNTLHEEYSYQQQHADYKINEEAAWEDKLRAEDDDEPQNESWASYNDDEKSETWDEWASRMSKEYYNRNKFGSSSHEPSDKKFNTSTDECKSGISYEKKRNFEKNIREHYKQESSRIKKATLLKEKRLYEIKCRKLFDCRAKFSADKIVPDLVFDDIPWPPEDNSQMLNLFSCDIDQASSAFQQYIRQQRIRWHPDKFVQRCGHRLIESDKSRILDRVKMVSQALNNLVAQFVS